MLNWSKRNLCCQAARNRRTAAARDSLPDEVFLRLRGSLFFGPNFLVTRNKLSFRDNLQQLLANAGKQPNQLGNLAVKASKEGSYTVPCAKLQEILSCLPCNALDSRLGSEERKLLGMAEKLFLSCMLGRSYTNGDYTERVSAV